MILNPMVGGGGDSSKLENVSYTFNFSFRKATWHAWYASVENGVLVGKFISSGASSADIQICKNTCLVLAVSTSGDPIFAENWSGTNSTILIGDSSLFIGTFMIFGIFISDSGSGTFGA